MIIALLTSTLNCGCGIKSILVLELCYYVSITIAGKKLLVFECCWKDLRTHGGQKLGFQMIPNDHKPTSQNDQKLTMVLMKEQMP